MRDSYRFTNHPESSADQNLKKTLAKGPLKLKAATVLGPLQRLGQAPHIFLPSMGAAGTRRQRFARARKTGREAFVVWKIRTVLCFKNCYAANQRWKARHFQAGVLCVTRRRQSLLSQTYCNLIDKRFVGWFEQAIAMPDCYIDESCVPS